MKEGEGKVTSQAIIIGGRKEKHRNNCASNARKALGIQDFASAAQVQVQQGRFLEGGTLKGTLSSVGSVPQNLYILQKVQGFFHDSETGGNVSLLFLGQSSRLILD